MELSKYVVENANVADLVPHPLSDKIFGQMSADLFADLVKDMGSRGLKYPLETDALGRVIAGSQRLRAARELSWETVPVIRHPELSQDDEIDEYLIKDNMLRRQLTVDQIYLSGQRLEAIYRDRARANMLSGVTLPAVEGKVDRHLRDAPGQAASGMGVSRRRYDDVRTIFEAGPPDLLDKVRSGQVSLTSAAKTVRSTKPRVAARQTTEIQSAAIRWAKWEREIGGWTKQIKKATRWLQEHPTDRLGPYAPRASGPCTELRTALQAALQEIQGEE